MGWLVQDLRFTLRTLAKSPVFTGVAVLSLAIGIGANTTIFTFVNAIFLKSLPVQHPERLVAIYTLDQSNPGYFLCSYPNYKDYRDEANTFRGLALYSTVPITLTGDGSPENLAGQIVTWNYFEVLGVAPVRGRAFRQEEGVEAAGQAVAVLSHGLWSRRFGGDPAIIGRNITLNHRVFTVVGVAPPGFSGINELVTAEVWVPMGVYDDVFPLPGGLSRRRALLFTAFGRLKPGVALPAAQAALRTVAARLEREYPEDNRGRTAFVLPLREAAIHPNSRGSVVMAGGLLMGMTGLVLLIACANVANLMLARASGRRREVAIRLALGAGRGRLIGQLLIESTTLSLAGGVVGILLAQVGGDLLWRMRPALLSDSELSPALDGNVMLFTVALALGTGILFGLIPALRSTSADLNIDLRDRVSQPTGSRNLLNVRAVLVILQVSLSLVALVGAGLFLESLRRAEQVDPGFDAAHLAVMSYDSRLLGYDQAPARALNSRVRGRIRAMAGVRSVCLTSNRPFRVDAAQNLVLDGQTPAGAGQLSLVSRVDGSFFDTMRIPILAGRPFESFDRPETARVAVVNQTLANRYWPGEPAVGKHFHFAGEPQPVEVVGVARDANYVQLGEAPRSMIYLCLDQNAANPVTVVVRVDGDPRAILASLRAAVQFLEPGLVPRGLETVASLIDRALWAPRMSAGLLSTFGALALLLAAVGMYGVLSYSVSQRVREMGIRMALGATAQNVLRQVLLEGMRLVAIGLALGWCAALWGGRLVAKLLFGVSPTDIRVFALVSAVLTAAALAACYVPARRATLVDPIRALHEE